MGFAILKKGDNMISEYTFERANALNKYTFRKIDMIAEFIPLWFDCINSEDVEERIYKGFHSHSFFEIHFVFSGKVYYEFVGTVIGVEENEALFIPPGVTHKNIKHDGKFFKIAIAFSIDLDYKFEIEKFKIPDDVINKVNHILSLSAKEDFVAPSLISAAILDIIYQSFLTLKINLPKQNESTIDTRVCVAKEFIENNTERLINIEDVSKECCLSKKQLCRLFKNYMNISVFEYITQTKLKKAKQLLNNNLTVKETGLILGFESESNFISFFKRHLKITPGAYRKTRSE